MAETLTIQEFLKQNEEKDLLRFSTAGSVDDGKSTLIGRLLHDSKLIYEDHLASLKRDSERTGSVEGDFDYALLLDGLKAEREQNITIDVAYRYFSTPKRKFIISDTPGHEQYTRNMATGASTANLAVILMDATQGVLTQTKRHSFIMSLLDIQHIVVAVNKMDLVDYDEEVFNRIRKDYQDFASKLDMRDIAFIPLSALKGDNVVERSENMPWFTGRPLLDFLETVHISSDKNLVDFRFPVQYVLRPRRDFRGYAGTVSSGTVHPGDDITVLPSGKKSKVKSIVKYDGELDEAFAAQAVTLTLEDEIDISRSDMLVHPRNTPHIENTFEAMVIWMNDTPFREDEMYVFKHTTNIVQGVAAELVYKVNVNSLHREEASELKLNEIGRARFKLNRPLMFDYYRRNHMTGSFVIIDRISNVTIGAGMIIERTPSEYEHTTKRGTPKSEHVHPHKSRVKLDERIKRLNQHPMTIWFTGLPKSGKSTISYALERKLFDMGYFAHVLDGENMRLKLSSDLGFSPDDRSENVRRASGVAELCNRLGLITIASFVTPYDEDRENVRDAIGHEKFMLVHLDTPLEECEKRDTEGLYEKARRGDIKNFTGITAPYEVPKKTDLTISTALVSVDDAVDLIISALKNRKVIK